MNRKNVIKRTIAQGKRIQKDKRSHPGRILILGGVFILGLLLPYLGLADMRVFVSNSVGSVPAAFDGDNGLLLWSEAHQKFVRYDGGVYGLAGAMPMNCGQTWDQPCADGKGRIPGFAVESYFVRQEAFYYKERLCQDDTRRVPTGIAYVRANKNIENQIFLGTDGNFYKVTGQSEWLYPQTEFYRFSANDSQCNDAPNIASVVRRESDGLFHRYGYTYYPIVKVAPLNWPRELKNPLKISQPSASPSPTTSR